MSAPWTIKQGDRKPDFRATLTERNPAVTDPEDPTYRRPVDLENADLNGGARLVLVKRDGKHRLDVALTIETPAADGGVIYEWQAGDTDVPGFYNGRIIVDWGNDVEQTFPTEGSFPVEIEADL